MKLSIITINYNNAEGLQKTIESVVNQTSQDFEYIIIDGGSTDGSVEVIHKYQDKCAYWISEPDRGIYHAMNKGIMQAKGEYCQFVNSGDYLQDSDVTERMLLNMPDCSFIYGNRLRQINGRTEIERSYAGRQITLLDMYRSTFFHATAYIKRSLFEKYGLYDESFRIVSDWKFFLIAIGLNDEKVIYKDINVVWFDSTGISSTNLELDKLERRAVLAKVLPQSILSDYQSFAREGVIFRRLKQNRMIWFAIINLYRVVFRIDKFSAYIKTIKR
ncbi:glycosyltransferase family 2 protein [Dyadobacter alkalitolerans]|uniref:glycosyltransferase family 2 protein n=1 Tax=Dyadobacter alkalitolerans TaxID=492736 RepID=UPI0003F7E50F|nr:glycosyltransferase family 2 protein [Dyadobacter alkalitolerans]